MRYPALSPLQQSQAETLFYDRLFGTDPAAFDYEIDMDGLVMGRMPLELTQGARQHQARGTETTLSAVSGAPSPERHEAAARAMLDLTRAVALSITSVHSLERINL